MSARGRLLIVDDEAGIRFGVREFFESQGYAVEEAASCAEALARVKDARPLDVAIVDYSLPDGTALDLLRARRTPNDVPMIVLTAHASIDLAVQAIKEGADQFVPKPVELDVLMAMVDRTLDRGRDHRQAVAERVRASKGALDPFLGTSPAMQHLAREARRLAESEVPVLIHGETGAGKGVLARWLHQASPRAAEAYVDLNCATLGGELLESELFGHDKGAFTGATAAKIGLLEAGHRGTVFLDEIGDLELAVQPKLLKVVEDKRFRRVGDVRERHTDVRFLAASHHDLPQMVAEKRFREDLFYRINTITLTVPPLRARLEDLPLLAEACLARMKARRSVGPVNLSADALAVMSAYSWPGNIRELQNVLERAVVLASGPEITAADLQLQAARNPTRLESRVPARETEDLSLEVVQVQHIRRVLHQEQGNVDRAAIRLGVPRSTLYQRIKKYSLDISGSRSSTPRSQASAESRNS